MPVFRQNIGETETEHAVEIYGKGKETAMAQKSTGKKTNTKSTSGKTSSGHQAKTPARREPAENLFMKQAGAYIMAVVGILLAVCMLLGDGVVGGGIQNLFCGLFGVIAYTLPIYFLILAFLWKPEWESGMLRWKIITAVVIVLFTSLLAHIFGGGPDTFHPAELY